MRRQGYLIAAALAMAGALPAGTIIGASPSTGQTMSTGSGGGNINAFFGGNGSAATRRNFFTGGGGSFFGVSRPTYIKRPFRTVAQDKRDARKARNRKRNKR